MDRLMWYPSCVFRMRSRPFTPQSHSWIPGKNSIQFDIEGDGAFIRSLNGVKELTEFNNYIELRLEDGTDTNQILQEVSARVKVRRFDLVEPSLYDIFIDMAKVDPSTITAEKGESEHV